MGTDERDAFIASKQASKQARGDTSYLTFANVLSAVSVVLLHTNGCFWTFSSTERYWLSANLIDAAFYYAVPVFFMISAATLVDYEERYGLDVYWRKRFSKTVVPYVFWSFCGLMFGYKTFLVADSKIVYVLNGLLTGSLVDVYWFFIPLFSVYLSIPLFAAVPKEKRKNLFTYIAIATFIICVAGPFAGNMLGLEISSSLTVGVGAGYLFFVPVGYLLSHYEVPKKVRIAIYVAGVAGLLVHVIGTYYGSMAMGEVDTTFKGYYNLPSVLYAVAIFLLIRQYGNKLMQVGWIRHLVRFLSRYTFAIYLLHRFVLKIVVKFLPVDIYSLAYRLLMPIPVITVIIIGTYVARKIPIMRRLLP